MKRTQLFLSLLLIPLIASAGCSRSDKSSPARELQRGKSLIPPLQAERLVGKWKMENNGGVLEFFSDGSYVARWGPGAERGRYDINGNRLTIVPIEAPKEAESAPASTSWQVTLLADKLTLTGSPDGVELALVFYGEGSSSVP